MEAFTFIDPKTFANDVVYDSQTNTRVEWSGMYRAKRSETTEICLSEVK